MDIQADMIKIMLAFLITNIFFPLFAQSHQEGWEFNPPADQFTSETLLDLRFINEDYAGQNKFIILSADSKSFISTNGKPMRSWAVNGAT